MWRGSIWSRRGAVLGVVVAIAGASACSDEESGDGGSDAGGSAGSAGASGSSGAGAASGGSAGNTAGGNAGSTAAGMGGSSMAGRGTGGSNAGEAGMGGDDGEAGMGGADAGDGGMGGMSGMGAGRGGMAGAGTGGVGGAGSGGTSGSAGKAGAGGAGSGGMAGGGMAGGGMSGAGGGGGTGGGEPAPINLFFSEYYEGTATPQASAVEIYNAGEAPVNLTQCSLRVYVNGSFGFSTILLITTLAPDEVFVVCSTSIGGSCDLLSPTMAMVTGNDAVSLVCGSEVQDIIGQTGSNPASGEWGTGLASTADNTMRRMCSVTTGDNVGIDAFNPVFQWLGAAANSGSDLGIRFCP